MRENDINHQSGNVDESNASGVIRDKLVDAMTPGYEVEFNLDEAKIVGAFTEDALTEQDALESTRDRNNDLM